jgi:taurine--2-oxoglutarate transaminase
MITSLIIMPPLALTEDDIDEAVSALDDALTISDAALEA